MIQAVSDGQYHVGMTGITIKEERKEKVDFFRCLYALGNVHVGPWR